MVLQTLKKPKKNRCGKHLAAPIGRPTTIRSAGVSGKEIELIQDGGQFKRQKDIYHHSLRPVLIICHDLPDPVSQNILP
jgi:hypothetical protein